MPLERWRVIFHWNQEKLKKTQEIPPHIHFIGIGGIGMSALAMILAKNGYSISGLTKKLL